MIDVHELETALAGFLQSPVGESLIAELGRENRYLRLAVGERCMGYTPVYILDGNGLRSAVESSAMAAAFSGKDQQVTFDNATVEELAAAIIEEAGHCCVASYMYWLEKRVAETDGIPFRQAA